MGGGGVSFFLHVPVSTIHLPEEQLPEEARVFLVPSFYVWPGDDIERTPSAKTVHST